MKHPFYPGEWAIKLCKDKPRLHIIYGNGDLNTKEAQEYYSYRNRIDEDQKAQNSNKTRY